MYKQLTILAFACALAAGCRDNSTTTTTGGDMATGNGGGGGGGTAGGGGTTGGGDMATTTFTKTSIAAMRAGNPGSFELDNVIVLGVTSSSKKPTIYVRDSGTPGDYTAIQVKCDAGNATHPCTVATALHAATIGQSVTIQGDYIKSTGFEEFYISGSATAFVGGAAGSAPTPVTVALADVQRNSSLASQKNWFQYVTVATPGTLDVYDLTPSEFVFTGATACPYQTGFGLIPSGTTGVTAPTACTGTTSQPTGLTPATANAAEILIGTDFFTSFTVSSDCKCAAMFTDTLVTPTMTATALSGILVPDSVYMSSPTVNYLYVAPISSTTDLKLQ